MDANENRKRVSSSYLKRQKERQVAFQEERYQRYYPTRNFTISPDLRTNISNVEKLYGAQGVNPDGRIIQDHPDDSLDDAGIGHRDIRHLNMLFPRLRHVGIVVLSQFGVLRTIKRTNALMYSPNRNPSVTSAGSRIFGNGKN